ncbi:transglutaminase-like domain-containing protein [Pseudolysinimonas yzui]|uniref:Putative transglutaminase-like protein n=1 Tax=Pseudolysinimonas yzui TaxID=2708254 RepID=A0A8J3GSR5_9MICO|nr:transglutaminase family protein [Pseudolysinimonas yzui]GHF24403.1 putative transglutaminase-like protein [Pseudolysinimonas yzui]
MRRDVTVTLDLESDGPAHLALAVAVATGYGATERFEATQSGRVLPVTVLDDIHGGRLHVLDVGPGRVHVEYSAAVAGTAPAADLDAMQEIRYLRPSRYCESDILRPIAVAEFSGLRGAELLAAVASWVGVRIAYVPGSSLPTDGAVRTLLSRRGVCRDFAHLVVAFLRALDVPARVVGVYAPGLSPMDFHAVAEAAIDGVWHVVDATTLAPRQSLVRIATGRDAADIAFLSARGDLPVRVADLRVLAVADELPRDDTLQPVVLH